MILAPVFIALTLCVTAALIWPLLRRRHAIAGTEQRDIVVYREQLTEVDNDVERGLLTKAQAEAARTEIHRRMLAFEDAELAAAQHGHRNVKPKTRKILAGLIAVLLPLLAALFYIMLGAPELPGKPFAERVNDPEFALASTAEDMQAKLGKAPSAEGYKRFADVLYMMKRYKEAAESLQKAIDLGASDAMTWSEMGEDIVLASDGAVVPEALGDFNKALKLDSREPRARFYLGLGEAQINNFRKAVSIWKGLQKDSPPGASWGPMVEDHIKAYSKEGGFDSASIEPSTPSGASPHGAVSTHPATTDEAAASVGGNMPDWAKDPQRREAMIKSMVEGLATKLEKNHGDVQGWMKLANAYHVLQQPDKAQQALDKALRYNPDNAELKAFAESFSKDK